MTMQMVSFRFIHFYRWLWGLDDPLQSDGFTSRVVLFKFEGQAHAVISIVLRTNSTDTVAEAACTLEEGSYQADESFLLFLIL